MLESKRELINKLKRDGYLRTPSIIKAFEKVKREQYIHPKQRDYAYADTPLPIGEGQTISQPLTIAFMMESLALEKGQKVLEIGTGSGYQAALLAELNPEGKIFSMERVHSLAERAREKLEKYKNIKVVGGNGALGLREHAPFDRIIITCACGQAPPALLDQLKVKGKLIAPVGGRFSQRMTLYEKTSTGVK